jgi:hypothetical protein
MTTLVEIRRARFERELWSYTRETYIAPRSARARGKRVVDQPPYTGTEVRVAQNHHY